jgi:hypothetical protein
MDIFFISVKSSITIGRKKFNIAENAKWSITTNASTGSLKLVNKQKSYPVCKVAFIKFF